MITKYRLIQLFLGCRFCAGSCVGTDACLQNGGDVGDNSCNGFQACFQNGASVSMWDIARLFVASEEFVLTYDSLNDEAFLDLLCLNVIGRPSDDEGAAYWLALMQGGLDRGGVTLQFSESQEFKNVTKTS